MKRDMDLVRAILNVIEEQHLPNTGNWAPTIEGYDAATILAHVELLNDAGLLKAKIMKGLGGSGGAHITGITWAGYEFINAAKDETIWVKAKSAILKHGSSMTFDLLLELLKAETRKRLGLP